MLRHVLASEKVGNFQDWQPWRGLVVATATQILDYVGGQLIIPQTVLNHRYWQEIRDGYKASGIPVCHVVLHADRTELTRRIDADGVETGARQWRLNHLDAYDAARSWQSQEGHVIDTTDLEPRRVAQIVAEHIHTTTAARPPMNY